MTVIYVLLLVAALICFILAAFNVAVGKVQLLALGLACWVLVSLIQMLHRL